MVRTKRTGGKRLTWRSDLATESIIIGRTNVLQQSAGSGSSIVRRYAVSTREMAKILKLNYLQPSTDQNFTQTIIYSI